MPRLDSRSKDVAERWTDFFRYVVGYSPRNTVAASPGKIPVPHLDAKLTTSRQPHLYAHLSEVKSVFAKTAYGIGEGLRECGLSWCSGVVSVFMAGYPREFMTAAGKLAESSPRHAAALVYGCNALHLSLGAKLRPVPAKYNGLPDVILPYEGQDELLRLRQRRAITRSRRYAKHLLTTVPHVPWDYCNATRGVHEVFQIAANAAELVKSVPAKRIDHAALLIIENLWARHHRHRDVKKIAARSFANTSLFGEILPDVYRPEIERLQNFDRYLEYVSGRNLPNGDQ